MALLFSTQIFVGEKIVTPNSRRIPCNQTHYVVASTASLYSASADESEMVCCFLIDQKMGPSSRINKKPEFDFLLVGSPAQSESENPTSWSEELAV